MAAGAAQHVRARFELQAGTCRPPVLVFRMGLSFLLSEAPTAQIVSYFLPSHGGPRADDRGVICWIV
jgi:hypothetical protein